MVKNITSNWVLIAVTVIATYVLLPLNLQALGQESYGVWLLVTAMTGYLTLLPVGIPMASVHFVARHAADKNYDELNKIIGNCAALYLMLGGASLLLGFGLLWAFERSYTVPAALLASARWTFLLMLGNIAVSFIGLLPHGILQAHHAFVARNAVSLGVLSARVLLTIVFVRIWPRMETLALVQLACTVVEMGCMWALVRKRFRHIRPDPFQVNWRTVRTIFSFSVPVLILGIGMQLMFLTDSLVIARYLHADQVPVYAVANSLAVYLMEFIIGIAAVVMPMTAKLHAAGNMDELRAMFLKWSKIAFSLTLLACSYLYVLGPGFIRVWVGTAFDRPAGEVLQILLLSAVAFLPVRAVCVPVLAGLGKPALPASMFVAAGILNLGLSIVLVGRWGLAGVAWGTAIPAAAFAGATLVATCRALNIAVQDYLRYVVAKATLGVLPVLLFLTAWRHLPAAPDYVSLAAAGTLAVILFAGVWVWYVYRNDPYADLPALLPKFAARYV